MGFSLNIPKLGGVDACEKCTLVTLDDSSLKLSAVFNPNKLKVSKSMPWNRHSPAGGDGEMLEFTNGRIARFRSSCFSMGMRSVSKEGRAGVKGQSNERARKRTIHGAERD